MNVLPVGKKEAKLKGKNGIGPRMKNGCANHKQNRAFTNGGYSVTYDVTDSLSFKKQSHTAVFHSGDPNSGQVCGNSVSKFVEVDNAGSQH